MIAIATKRVHYFALCCERRHSEVQRNWFLDARCGQREVDELTDPGSGEPEPACHIRAVADNAAVDSGLNLVRKRAAWLGIAL